MKKRAAKGILWSNIILVGLIGFEAVSVTIWNSCLRFVLNSKDFFKDY
jgi:hypothetical protein